jgi:hypothetical protein
MQSVERAGGADEALQLDDAIGALYTRCLADTQRHVPHPRPFKYPAALLSLHAILFFHFALDQPCLPGF